MAWCAHPWDVTSDSLDAGHGRFASRMIKFVVFRAPLSESFNLGGQPDRSRGNITSVISAKSLKSREFLGYWMLWLASMTMVVPVCPAMAAEPAAPPAMPAAAPAISPDYRIGPGDPLKVSGFQNAELTSTLPVRPDGKISTPLVEDMVAVGKTPSQLARDLEKSLSEYIKAP